MGLYEEWKLARNIGDVYVAFTDWYLFNHRGIFSKKVTVDYKTESEGPWMHFSSENTQYSFKVHNLELHEDFIFWQGVAQKNREVTLEGFVNHLFSIGMGNLRGTLSVKGERMELGVFVKSGRITKLRTNSEINLIHSYILSAVTTLMKDTVGS